MKALKLVPILVLALVCQASLATISEDDSQDQNNKTDEQGRKQGHWIYYGKDKPNKPEYAPEDKVEEGPYKDNRKHGMWKAYYPGNRIKSEIEYKYNRPNGKFVKYHDTKTGDPVVAESATWKGNKYVGKYVKYHPNGKEAIVREHNAAGKTDGKVTYKYPNGQTEFEFSTVNGQPEGPATRFYPNGDVKEQLSYDAEGNLASQTKKDRVNPAVALASEPTKEAPKGDANKQNPGANEGNQLHDVYTKIYNDNQDLEMDGYFLNGKLHNGKLYKYDKNGLLYKIEIYKDGKYYGDGVLEF